jgi:hypothetical protein
MNSPPVTNTAASYDRDFYSWTQRQAGLLRQRRFDELDIDNIAEELETLGRSEKRELESRFEILLLHLLKWQYQPERRSNSWKRSIIEQRRQLPRVIDENPGLKPLLPKIFANAYGDALAVIPLETDLATEIFPDECQWTPEQTLNDEFWPD